MNAKAAANDVGVVVELPLGDAVWPTFNLEKAVCSHGLFMMAPNHWDLVTKTLQRPLRLAVDPLDDDHEVSVAVEISHPSESPHALRLRVFGTDTLSPQHRNSLLGQVKRMLRLSDEENRRVKEFHEVHSEAKERGFGRVFRSPTLFEDMIKCILLCNCQWSRTLSMARALCELQSELEGSLSCKADNEIISKCPMEDSTKFMPKTPGTKETKRKSGIHKCSTNLATRFMEAKAAGDEGDTKMSYVKLSDSSVKMSSPTLQSFEAYDIESSYIPEFQPPEQVESCPSPRVGNFPSPRELAKLDEKFLARSCNLGYRAGRILNLAREVIEGKIQLEELEEACNTLSTANYDKLFEKLKALDGFGPFTCANVLMCMGFYHVIPTDSETIRHLKQVHAKSSSIRMIQKDVEVIYGKYAPFQFLAYWSEVWHFYEEWFGKLSEMSHSNYKLITAANMRPKKNGLYKRIKVSSAEINKDVTVECKE